MRIVEGEGVQKGIAIAYLGDMGNIDRLNELITSYNYLIDLVTYNLEESGQQFNACN